MFHGFSGGAPGTYHMLLACSPIEAFLCPNTLRHLVKSFYSGAFSWLDQNDDSS